MTNTINLRFPMICLSVSGRYNLLGLILIPFLLFFSPSVSKTKEICDKSFFFSAAAMMSIVNKSPDETFFFLLCVSLSEGLLQ